MKPLVAILMGSDSDAPVLKPCADVLKELGIPFEVRVLSAHRTPDETTAYVKEASRKGVRVLIAAAGGAAHLAGVAAANTLIPVIGIPVETSSLKGLDSLLSTVQMPAGTPVATVAVGSGGVKNAAYLAARILALGDEKLAKRLGKHRDETRRNILQKSVEL